MPPTDPGQHRSAARRRRAQKPPAPARATEAPLRSKGIRSFAATGLQTVAVRLLSLVSFIILARLLSPRDYGVAAIAGVFAALAAVLAAGGFSQAIVQKPTVDEGDLDSVFWVGFVIGLAMTGLSVGAAWPLAAFFDLPELKPVLWVMSPMFLAIAASSPQVGLLQREFRFALLARITVSANLVATIIGVAAAFAGAGYWALVIQTLIAPVFTSIAVWIVSDYRPATAISRERFTLLFRTSRQFMGERLMTFAYEQTDKAAVGRVLGNRDARHLLRGVPTVFIMLEVLARSVQWVALPAFARLQHETRRLADGYVTAIRLCTTISIPVFAYTGVAAHDLVSVLFGDKWLAAVPAMQVFCAYGVLQSYLAYNTVFLQAVGRASTVLRLAFIGTVVQIVAVVLAVQHGTTWVAASFLLRVGLVTPLMLFFVASALPRGALRRALVGVVPPALSSAVMAGLVYALLHDERLSHPALAVGITLPVAVAVYVGTLVLVSRRHVLELWRLGVSLRGGSSAGTPPDPPAEPAG